MRTTLLAALRAWREVGEPGTHATPDELYALASAGAADASASVVVHLTRCGPCAGEFAELSAAVREAVGWDLALAKAAAAPLSAPVAVSTECGKYSIALYPRAGVTDEALVTVEVLPPFQAVLEGARVTVRDRGGRELLSAPIVLGRASGRVRKLASIDCTRLTVRLEESAAEQGPP